MHSFAAAKNHQLRLPCQSLQNNELTQNTQRSAHSTSTSFSFQHISFLPRTNAIPESYRNCETPGPSAWSNGIPMKQREFGRPNSAILIDAGGTWWQTPMAFKGSLKRILCCYALQKYRHYIIAALPFFLPKTPKQHTLGSPYRWKRRNSQRVMDRAISLGLPWDDPQPTKNWFSSGVQPSRQQGERSWKNEALTVRFEWSLQWSPKLQPSVAPSHSWALHLSESQHASSFVMLTPGI